MHNICIIGDGNAALVHCRAVEKCQGARVAGISVASSKRGEQLKEMFPQACIHQDYKEAIEDALFDAFIIAVPPFIQAEILAHALKNNKNILCEKLLAIDIDEQESLSRFYQDYNGVCAFNFCYRYIPELELFFQKLQENICGDINYIDAKWVLPNRLDENLTYHWKGQKEKGGGVLRNFGIHLLDLLFKPLNYDVDILGARQNILFKSRNDDSGNSKESTGDETTVVLARNAENIPYMITFSMTAASPEGLRIDVVGSEGTLSVQNILKQCPFGLYELTFSTATEKRVLNKNNNTINQASMETMFLHSIARFTRMLDGMVDDVIDFEDAKNVMNIILDIEKKGAV